MSQVDEVIQRGSSESEINLIKKVKLDSSVYEVIISHALSNEKEENMGLLIGNVEEMNCLEDERYILNVYSLMLLERLDKRQDRVEISPEQLSNATEFAEKLSEKYGSKLRIIGWYHSHPNITVWPSHVDIKTQSMYQMMDRNFIGLILSVFNDNRQNHLNTIELICFQSNMKLESMFLQIPVEIESIASCELVLDTTLNVYDQIPSILMKEERSTGSLNRALSKMTWKSNLFSLMSDVGIYLHSASRIMDCTYLQTVNSLKCRKIVNNILINFNSFYLKRLREEADKIKTTSL